MTPEELDFNNWSAETVMQFTDISYTGRRLDGHREYYVRDKDGILFCWSPTTDANQCFMVVEKLRGLGWVLHLHHNIGWIVFWENINNKDQRQKTAYHPDNPRLAILQATHAAWTAKKGEKMAQVKVCDRCGFMQYEIAYHNQMEITLPIFESDKGFSYNRDKDLCADCMTKLAKIIADFMVYKVPKPDAEEG